MNETAIASAGTTQPLIPGISNNEIRNFFAEFSPEVASGAAGNVFGITFGDVVKQMINSNAELPQFLKDELSGLIDESIESTAADVPAEAQEQADDIFEQLMQYISERIAEDAQEEVEAAGAEGSEGTGGADGGKAKGASGGAGNWLAMLAKAMGKVAGEHLARSVELGQEIASNAGGSGPEAAEKMTQLQAEMQAETQMFKLAQEALTTIVKTVGEALTTTARKQ